MKKSTKDLSLGKCVFDLPTPTGQSFILVVSAGLSLQVKIINRIYLDSDLDYIFGLSVAATISIATIAFLGLGAAFYLGHSSIQHRRYGPFGSLSDDPILLSATMKLCRESQLDRHPNIFLSPKLGQQAIVFGDARVATMLLGTGMRLLVRREIDRFSFIVLHELAHLKAHDIKYAYGSLAALLSFATLVPLYLALHLVSAIDFLSFTDGLVRYLRVARVPVMILCATVVLFSLYCNLLRMRESIADLFASARIDSNPFACDQKTKSTFFRGIFSFHPNERIRASRSTHPVTFLGMNYTEAIVVGFVLGLWMTALGSIADLRSAFGVPTPFQSGDGLRVILAKSSWIVFFAVFGFLGLVPVSIFMFRAGLAEKIEPNITSSSARTYIFPALLFAAGTFGGRIVDLHWIDTNPDSGPQSRSGLVVYAAGYAWGFCFTWLLLKLLFSYSNVYDLVRSGRMWRGAVFFTTIYTISSQAQNLALLIVVVFTDGKLWGFDWSTGLMWSIATSMPIICMLWTFLFLWLRVSGKKKKAFRMPCGSA